MSQKWKEEDVERILIDPFSSLTVALSLTQEHDPPLSTDEWIEVNTNLIKSIGAESWLKQMVQILEGKEEKEAKINPYNAICIDERFAVEHEPIVPIETWISANAKLLPQQGIERWLKIFLDILEGDIPTAPNPRLGAIPDAPFGYVPEGYQSRPRYSFRRVGKSKKKKRRK